MQEYMQVVNNKKLFRFEIALENGEYATLTYRWLKGSMVLMHTIVPKAARGKGVGSYLVKYVLEYAIAQRLQIIAYCQFVRSYMDKHREYEGLLDPEHIK